LFTNRLLTFMRSREYKTNREMKMSSVLCLSFDWPQMFVVFKLMNEKMK